MFLLWLYNVKNNTRNIVYVNKWRSNNVVSEDSDKTVEQLNNFRVSRRNKLLTITY